MVLRNRNINSSSRRSINCSLCGTANDPKINYEINLLNSYKSSHLIIVDIVRCSCCSKIAAARCSMPHNDIANIACSTPVARCDPFVSVSYCAPCPPRHTMPLPQTSVATKHHHEMQSLLSSAAAAATVEWYDV